jgi:5-methyltetrahydropteroyltriglutamate--homocysteine methyltransferase
VAKFVAVDQLMKVVIPGPVTAARMARDDHYGDIASLADALASALADEVHALVEAGATCFQVDEPLLCRYPEDLELVARTSDRIFQAAGAEATTVLSTYYGDLTAIGDRLTELPGTHLGLDMVSGAGNYDLLSKLPPGRGVALGVFDARTSRQEDAADVAARLEAHRETLTRRDVIVGPNAGLELLSQDQGFDKLLHARYVVEKLSQEWKWDS